MAELTIFHHGQPILRESLTSRITIGSAQQSDICLLDSVAPLHARIEVTPNSILLVEQEGQVFINGQRVIGSKTLNEGDMFDLGAYRFQITPDNPSRSAKKAERTATASLQGEEGATTVIPTIRFLSPVKKKFRRTRLLIGRATGCDLILENQFVSGQHAELFLQNGTYFIRDLHSRNGTYVNDYRVTERALPTTGTIRFGRYSLSYKIDLPVFAGSEEVQGIPVPGLKPGDPKQLIVGQSAELRTLMERLKKVAPSDDPVLLLGETGTGKDLLARYLHYENPKRRSGPFVVVNCATIPQTLADSQLFGHLKGSFTGATEDQRGFFQQADGGTLFLDEIAELPLESQARLLRVIEDGLVRPMGSPRETSVNVRLICATNEDLETARFTETFRNDLYERFQWIIRVPPLRDRLEDIPLLARYFLARHSPSPLSIHSDVFFFLQSLPWGGNIRALNRAVRRAITNALARRSDTLMKEDFEISETEPAENVTASKLRKMKRDSLLETIEAHKGNVSKTAEALGVSRITIHKWLKYDKIDLSRFKRFS